MKSKISILVIFLAFIITGCYSSNENEATLTLHFGGSSNSYSASALTNWPPNDNELGSLSYEISLKSSSGEISEKALGSDSMITFNVTPGDWTIEITAYSDNELYAYGTNRVAARPGQNHVVITMYRAGNYDIKINVLPSEVSIPKGRSYSFNANTFYGSLVNSSDRIHDSYKWSVSGQQSGATMINTSTGDLTVDLNETAPTLTVKAESVNKSSIYGTATVTVVDQIHAQTPTFIELQNITCTVYDSLTLTVIASVPDGGTLSYQWYKKISSTSNWEMITGEIKAGYTPAIMTAGTTYYYVEITNTIPDNGDGGTKTTTVKSNEITVTIQQPVAKVSIGGTDTYWNTLQEAFDSITSGTATVTVLENIPNQAPISISGTKTINLVSDGANEIQLGSTGSLLTISSGVTLRIGDSSSNGGASSGTLTLKGINPNTASLIRVSGGTLELYVNAIITSNNYSSSSNSVYGGGGVYVASGGTFTMNGGSIEGNSYTTSYPTGGGGGVYVDNNATFTMNSGNIERNISTGSWGGGGVFLWCGTFTMNGGNIKDNNSDSGGGVYLYTANSEYTPATFTMNGGTIGNNNGYECVRVGDNSTFTMSGGNIKDNNIPGLSYRAVIVNGANATFAMSGGTIEGNNGVGVSVINNATFTMSSGTISANTGGGVSVSAEGTFTMSGGTIEGNSAYSGGGVYVYGGTFTMNGGSIEGNSASYEGGGVYVSGGTFTMSGGIIYGNESMHGDLKNTAWNVNSASLYLYTSNGGTAVYGGAYEIMYGPTIIASPLGGDGGTDATLGQ
ncbi:MAG: hypothetical protein FWH53_02465 [Leptospirales bacterium]|nr:hypothetical protein [Leptospirales bacterium]